MKKLFLSVLFSFLSFCAMAQDDDLCTWTTMTLNKSFGKWNFGLMSEYRHRIHEGVSKTDQYIARPSVAYKVLPWLTLRYNVDFASTSSGFMIDFIPELNFQKKVGDFSFSFRQRSMTMWKVERETASTVLRSRAKVDYSIPKTPVSVHFAIEPYWCMFSKDDFSWFDKARWYAGFDIKLFDGLVFRPEYVCQAYHTHRGRYNRRTYDDHVIYMTFAITL